MIKARNQSEASPLWIMLLTVAGLLTTLLFACATPFPSLAALAAVHMKRRDGVALMIATWVVSQTVGFCFMGYPWDGSTALSGVAIGTSALAAVLVASVADGRAPMASPIARLAIAYLVAFVVFKAVIALWSPLMMGHASAALSAPIVARQFVRYAAVLAGLYAIFRVLVAAGIPAPMGVNAQRPLAT